MDVQQFVDIEIHGPHEDLVQLPERIERHLDRGWSRDYEAEERGSTLGLSDAPMYAFSCTQRENRPAANLVLTFAEMDKLYVPNIVPQEYGDLSYDEYNEIAKEFYRRFVAPSADQMGLDAHISPEANPITAYASEEAIAKLKRFSHAANKTTGSSHPNDRNRWYEFLIAVHSEGARMNSDILTRWLQAEGGWPEDKAIDLAVEFEFGRGLLEAYEQSR